MQLTAKYIDMESAEFTAVLHTEDAREIGVREQDRVRIKHERRSAVTDVQTTDTVVKTGDGGYFRHRGGVRQSGLRREQASQHRGDHGRSIGLGRVGEPRPG